MPIAMMPIELTMDWPYNGVKLLKGFAPGEYLAK